MTLHYIAFQATVLDESMIETKYELEEIVKLVNAAIVRTEPTSELYPYIE